MVKIGTPRRRYFCAAPTGGWPRLKSPSLRRTTARRLFSSFRRLSKGSPRSVPLSPSLAGVAKGRVMRSFAPPERSGVHRSEARAFSTHSARATISSAFPSPASAAGRRASRVFMEPESSQRIAIFGFVVGLMIVRHSGCQSRITTMAVMKNRSISKAAVRPGCGLRFHETTQSQATPSKAAMPSQRVRGVGLR